MVSSPASTAPAADAVASRPLPTYRDVEQAALRLAGHAIHTPLLRSPALDRLTGARVLIKPETLQRTGSFKFRGAFNKIRKLVEEGPKPKAIVAFSSGNHAQGVAAAAALMGLPATIVMPADAPAIKINNTRALGAEVIAYDRYRQDREQVAQKLAEERGAAIVRPYDDPDIIAGQGTIGREIASDALALGLPPEIALVPAGGGGLIAGTGLALKHALPGIKVYGCEPAGFDDTKRSLEAGRRVANAPDARSICDALMATTPGELTFALNRQQLAGGLAVSDDEVMKTIATAHNLLKLVVEPGGSVALAALLAGKLDVKGRTVAVVLSGGNVDPDLYARAIAQAG
ncbi:MAG TPA: threonine/serine dehydratase [Hypericibacter adhaerens]|uniref:Serine/threonine dehydratase n=1 Tax=Hypericibacter adhaerens TaxID=2602016 RepID=A0A5J6MZK4_9PROT|nr:threonine/serine dehydratase [Hypericibacter adhaerens]QEX22781.1 serine/threonine dehydratase [Hypericibacter adhaerens]HWA44931.1 threonine/serine dehydratase [Hypericibacter adhaerens]